MPEQWCNGESTVGTESQQIPCKLKELAVTYKQLGLALNP